MNPTVENLGWPLRASNLISNFFHHLSRTNPNMKIVWKKKKNEEENGKKRSRTQPISLKPNLPFQSKEEEEEEEEEEDEQSKSKGGDVNTTADIDRKKQMAESFETLGNKLAEDGNYSEALQKWEAVITLMPKKAILHEQKAQVLLEMGDAWSALKAATRATELEPLWAEAWITLGRAQLNYGEPELAIKSFEKALEIKPNHEEALDDRETALRLVKRRKQLHLIDSSINHIRYKVGDKVECSNAPIHVEDEAENPNASTQWPEDDSRIEK